MKDFSAHLDKLRIFEAVCRNGSLRTAAREVHLTQPSVSRALQTLEHAVGALLLIRGRRGVQPTTAGHKFLAFATNVLMQAKDVGQQIASSDAALAGILRIGTYETLTEYLWPGFLLHLREIHPNLNVAMRTNSEKDHMRGLEDQDLDLVVDAEPLQREGFISWALYKDRFAVYATEKSRRRSTENQSQLPVVYVPNASGGDDKSIRSYLKLSGEQWRPEIQMDSFSTVKRLILDGIGIGVLPMRLAEREVASGALSIVSEMGMPKGGFGTHRICVTTLSRRADDHRLLQFIGLLKKFSRHI